MVCCFHLGYPREMLENSYTLLQHRNSDWNSREASCHPCCVPSTGAPGITGGRILCCVTVCLTAACSAPLCEPSPFSRHAHSQTPSLRTTMLYPRKCCLTWKTLSGHWGKWHEGIITTCQPKFLDLLLKGHCSSRKKGLFVKNNQNDFFFKKVPKRFLKERAK